MRRFSITTLMLLLSLAVVPAAFAHSQGPKPKPTVTVPTNPNINGAVYTTVDTHHPNYAAECHNGNPAVNCNQYLAKEFVYLNGGPTKNSLTPNGVYFYAVLVPGGQAYNANDGDPKNLSDDYDCYLNRRIQVTNGEVTGIYSQSTNCGTYTAPHLYDPPFVQLFPYANTTNPGGEYIMAVCYIGPDSTSRLPAGGVDTNKSCKFDAFKVMTDDTKPTCKLVSTTPGPPKYITVLVQDEGSGIESVSYDSTNATVTYPDPLQVGQSNPFYLKATKIDQTKSSTLVVQVTDIAGNVTDCDPVMPARRVVHIAGNDTRVISGVYATQTSLKIRNGLQATDKVVVRVNGHTLTLRNLKPGEVRFLRLKPAFLMPGSKNKISIARGLGRGYVQVTLN